MDQEGKKFRLTETESHYHDLEKMSVDEIIRNINREDASVAAKVEAELESIKKLIEAIVPLMKLGGRLFYIGAGTSGRLGIVDASECPPTFGIEQGKVIGLIAGGDQAIRKAVEFAEDNPQQGWVDLKAYSISSADAVIGIAASGTTPYVVHAIEKCRKEGIVTGSICCNPGSLLSQISGYPVSIATGAEFVTGSTRMKAGTAQKMVLNMISTAVMIQLGRVKGNRMVDMQLSNDKLIERGARMLMDSLKINEKEAVDLLRQHGSVRAALRARKTGTDELKF